MTLKNALLALTASLLVAACVSTSREIEYYDADCEIHSKKLVLDTQPLGNLSCIQFRDCLATTLVIGAGSTIISGSIVVVGNTVYWLQRVGKCAARPVNRIQSPPRGE